MASPNINQRLNGLEPLSYAGVNSVQPPDFVTKPRDPGPTDSKNFYLGTIWLNTATEGVWMLVSLVGNVATWVMIIGAAGSVLSLTGNSGGAVFPTAGNINVVGDGVGINIVGVPGSHTLTASLVGGGVAAQSFPTDSGTATPSALGALTIHGTHGLNTSGSGSTVTVAINNAITLGDLVNLAAGVAALNAETGDITITANAGVGNLNLPNTTSTGNGGIITQGGTGFSNRVFYTSSGNSIYIGAQSGNLTNTGGGTSVCVGYQTGLALTTGGAITAVGYGAMASATTTSSSCAFGNLALTDLTTGIDNTGIGFHALTELTTGSNNVALGDESADQLLTGSYNLALGANGTGSAWTGAESSNIALMNSGVLGESNVMRLGTSGSGNGQVNKTFIAGVAGVTTTVADAVQVLVSSSTGQFGVTSSSLRYKDNIVDMGSYSDVIRSLRPVVFNYKEHAPESKSVGLIAEEVETVAPHLVAYNKDGEVESVKYHDLVPMLLNEVIKLRKEMDELLASKSI